MVSVVNVARLGEFVRVRRVDEVSYLFSGILILGVLVLVFDLGLDIEEGIAGVLLSSLAAVLL